jgi:hypothetical protein
MGDLACHTVYMPNTRPTDRIPESDAGALLIGDTIRLGCSVVTVIGVSDRNPETDEITVCLESTLNGNVSYETFGMLETVYILTNAEPTCKEG